MLTEIGSESVVSAVLKNLQKNHPNCKRYRDAQTQDIKRPCFFVEQLALGNEQQLGGRSRRGYRIKITFLTDQTSVSFSQYMRAMGERLFSDFKFLEIAPGDIVIGRNLEYEIVGEELIFTAEFPMHLMLSSEPQQQMQNLEPKIINK